MPEPRHSLSRPFAKPPEGSFLDQFARWAGWRDQKDPPEGVEDAFAELFHLDCPRLDKLTRADLAAAGLTYDETNRTHRIVLASYKRAIHDTMQGLWAELASGGDPKPGSPGLDPTLCMIALCETARIRCDDPELPFRTVCKIAAQNLGPGIRTKHVLRAVQSGLTRIDKAKRDVPDYPGSGELRTEMALWGFRDMGQRLREFRQVRAT